MQRRKRSYARETYYILCILGATVIAAFTFWGPEGFRDMKRAQVELEAHRLRVQMQRQSNVELKARIQALKRLHENGIHTYAFIGPLLPMNPEALAEKIKPYVHHVWIDRMNYVSRTLKIYKSMRLAQWLEDDFTDPIIYRLQQGFTGKDIRLC